MGKKINPNSFRIGVINDWSSRWYKSKDFADYLREDLAIRNYILKSFKQGAIKDVIIERSESSSKIKIYAGRPGVIIGRGGSGIETIKNSIRSLSMSIRSKIEGIKNTKTEIEIEVIEIKNFEENAALVAQSVAEQLEKRVSFRRVLKTTLDSVAKQKAVKGVKIMIAGRLNGADMSRREWVISGGIPLHTLRANIDYAKSIAYTTHGTIGVKVWIYKGEVFETREKNESSRDLNNNKK